MPPPLAKTAPKSAEQLWAEKTQQNAFAPQELSLQGTTPAQASVAGSYAPPPNAFGGGGSDMQALQKTTNEGQHDAAAMRLQGQREFLTGRHLGMSGGDINPNTGREAGNAFDNGTFDLGNNHFGLTPTAQLASQGGRAQNQWGALGGVKEVDAGQLQGLNAQANQQGQLARAPFTPAPDFRNEHATAQPQSVDGTVMANAFGGNDIYASGSPYLAPGQAMVGFSRSPADMSKEINAGLAAKLKANPLRPGPAQQTGADYGFTT